VQPLIGFSKMTAAEQSISLPGIALLAIPLSFVLRSKIAQISQQQM